MAQESRTVPATSNDTALKVASPNLAGCDVPSPPHRLSHITPSLLEKCLYNIIVCVVRCPTHFKPLYQLSLVLDKMGLSKVMGVI